MRLDTASIARAQTPAPQTGARATGDLSRAESKGHVGRILSLLALVYLVVIAAGFVAPADPVVQNRELTFAPPTRLHFVGPSGELHWRPFVHPLVLRPGTLDTYEEDRTRLYPVRFFVRSTPVRIAGLFTSDRRLLGTDSPTPLFLLGSDQYGRDLFSRLLYGGQISLFAGLLGAALSLGVGVLLGGVAGLLWGLARRGHHARGRALPGAPVAVSSFCG